MERFLGSFLTQKRRSFVSKDRNRTMLNKNWLFFKLPSNFDINGFGSRSHRSHHSFHHCPLKMVFSLLTASKSMPGTTMILSLSPTRRARCLQLLTFCLRNRALTDNSIVMGQIIPIPDDMRQTVVLTDMGQKPRKLLEWQLKPPAKKVTASGFKRSQNLRL